MLAHCKFRCKQHTHAHQHPVAISRRPCICSAAQQNISWRSSPDVHAVPDAPQFDQPERQPTPDEVRDASCSCRANEEPRIHLAFEIDHSSLVSDLPKLQLQHRRSTAGFQHELASAPTAAKAPGGSGGTTAILRATSPQPICHCNVHLPCSC